MENNVVLIVADIHASMVGLDRTLQLAERFEADKIVILGDTFGVDAKAMVEKLNKIAKKLVIVKGNNDWYYEPEDADFLFMEYGFVYLGKTLAYVCHGHRLDDMNLEKYGTKVILQGHIHRPFIETYNGVTRVCPGSIASPRFGSKKTFALYRDGKITIYSDEMEVFDEIEIP